MVWINEWLPNPAGADAGGEWLELYNRGEAPVNLGGWRLANGSGREVKLRAQIIGPGEYLVLRRGDTKLTLRNRNETLLLYNTRGELEDRVGFLGNVPEGKSVGRLGGRLIILKPTPGNENQPAPFGAVPPSPAAGSVFARQPSAGEIMILSLLVGVVVTAICLWAIRNHAYLSQLFFPGDEKIGRGTGSVGDEL